MVHACLLPPRLSRRFRGSWLAPCSTRSSIGIRRPRRRVQDSCSVLPAHCPVSLYGGADDRFACVGSWRLWRCYRALVGTRSIRRRALAAIQLSAAADRFADCSGASFGPAPVGFSAVFVTLLPARVFFAPLCLLSRSARCFAPSRSVRRTLRSRRSIPFDAWAFPSVRRPPGSTLWDPAFLQGQPSADGAQAPPLFSVVPRPWSSGPTGPRPPGAARPHNQPSRREKYSVSDRRSGGRSPSDRTFFVGSRGGPHFSDLQPQAGLGNRSSRDLVKARIHWIECASGRVPKWGPKRFLVVSRVNPLSPDW